jgi:prefoldin subunit 5
MKKTSLEYKQIEEKFSQAVTQHKKYISEFKNQLKLYHNVDKLLIKLPDKISHPCMVPLGELACVPGELYHTNEILVYLGMEFHSKVSAKTAREIINQRSLNLKKNIEFEESKLNQLYIKMGLAKEVYQPKEIFKPQKNEFEQIPSEINSEEEVVEITEFEKFEDIPKKKKGILKKEKKEIKQEIEEEIDQMFEELEEEEEEEFKNINEEININNENPQHEVNSNTTDEEEFMKYFQKTNQSKKKSKNEDDEEENFERNEEILDEAFNKFFEKKVTFKENDKKVKFDSPFSGKIVERETTYEISEVKKGPSKVSKFKQSRMENK